MATLSALSPIAQTRETNLSEIDRSFLSNEITSADMAGLKRMNLAVGLDTTGTADELRANLYRYYQLEPPEAHGIELKKAETVFSGSTQDLKQRIVRFSGGVELLTREGGTTHTIEAETIEINRDAHFITAIGGVRYTMRNSSSDVGQTFSARTMLFESASWSGLSLEIRGRVKSQTAEGEPLVFHYTAKRIRKGPGGLITLDGVVVTSSDNVDDPYYKLRAGKLWNLSSNDWVAQNVTFYLGRVPVFFLPFFYQANRTLFFNPVVGFKSREGVFVDTTTYLVGAPDAEDAPLGLNLASPSGEAVDYNPNQLKLLVDYYGRLGVFTGIDGVWDLANLKFTGGLGFSRTLFGDTSVYPSSGEVKQEWNDSYIQGLRLPFRFGLNTKGDRGPLSYGFEVYSDPFFAKDFFNRSERGAWFGFLVGADTPAAPLKRIDSTAAYLRYKQRFEVGLPGLDYVSVDYLNMEATFLSKADAYMSAHSPDSPNASFFTPNLINLPNAQFQMGAEWWITGDKEREDDPQAAPDKPWGDEILPKIGVTDVFAPAPVSVQSEPPSWRNRLFYTLSGNQRLYYPPDASAWDEPYQVKLDFKDIRSFSSAKLTMGAESSRSDDFFFISDSIGMDGRYRKSFDPGASSGGAATLLEDKLINSLYLSNAFAWRMRPLISDPNWSKSILEYQLDTDFYRNAYDAVPDAHTGKTVFDPRAHRGVASFRYENSYFWAFSSNESDIPPLELKGTTETGIGAEIFGLSAQSSVYATNAATDSFGNVDSSIGLAFNVAYKPVSFFSIFGASQWDFSRGMRSAKAGVNLFGLAAAFVWEERPLVSWNGTDYLWSPTLDANGVQRQRFVPSYLDITLNQVIPFKPFWHDRIVPALNLTGEWKLDWLQYNNSLLTFGLGFKMSVYKILDLSVTLNSVNRSTHLYIPFMRDRLGVPASYNFFGDLLKSFNIFKNSNREESFFKMQNVNLSAALNLHDWQVAISYTGSPNYSVTDINKMWGNAFTFAAKWSPFPGIRSEFDRDIDDTWAIR